MLKAIIIEDEKSSRITLQNMINDFCKGVEIVASVDSLKPGVRAIQAQPVDFIFLDIELPEENGFKIFDYFPKPDFDIIFTTAYDEYALRALKMSAVDYLLKPLDLEELRLAIQKIQKKRTFQDARLNLKVLKENLSNKFSKLALPTNDGLFFIEIEEIIRCEAQGNYTMFFLVDQQQILISKTLKIYSSLLEPFNFFRISRTHLINLNHIKKFGRQKSPTATMDDGTVLNVSLGRKNEFLKKIDNLY